MHPSIISTLFKNKLLVFHTGHLDDNSNTVNLSKSALVDLISLPDFS